MAVSVIRRMLGILCLIGAPLPAAQAVAQDARPRIELGGVPLAPDARFDPVGTARLQLSAVDPYVNTVFGVQVAPQLSVAIRQTAEVSDPREDAKRLYPGIDLKLRLAEESEYRPAIALGLQSAVGHRRLAGEYLAFSKRYWDLDFKTGIGWGRLGSAGHATNPLKFLGGHFDRDRLGDSERANGPEDWFTGEDIGFFGGVAWDTGIEGLSLFADWNADRYTAESHAFAFDAPSPWTAGLAYDATDWATISAGTAGGDKLFASLSLHGLFGDWPGRPARRAPPRPDHSYRSGDFSAERLDVAAEAEDIRLETAPDANPSIISRLLLKLGDSLPFQLGRTLRLMNRKGGEDAEGLIVQPVSIGLNGPSIRIVRRDVERALAFNNGSPQEIWRHTLFGAPLSDSMFPKNRALIDRPIFYGIGLDTKASLSEEDQGILYRTSLVGSATKMLGRHLFTTDAVRVNLLDNIDDLNEFRPRAILPVRSDEDEFAARRVGLERTVFGWMDTIQPSLHAMAAVGYLEEMYAGGGGEVLYRPFGKTVAVGAEAWQAFKREPQTTFNLGLNGDHLVTGHIKAWYEVPDSDVTFGVKFGRYLAEDVGGTFTVGNKFDNGSSFEAFVTATDQREDDVFGGTTQLFSGIRFKIPLGNLPLVPSGAYSQTTVAPIGRDAGQAIDNPMPLYEVTEPLSYRHAARNWRDVVR